MKGAGIHHLSASGMWAEFDGPSLTPDHAQWASGYRYRPPMSVFTAPSIRSIRLTETSAWMLLPSIIILPPASGGHLHSRNALCLHVAVIGGASPPTSANAGDGERGGLLSGVWQHKQGVKTEALQTEHGSDPKPPVIPRRGGGLFHVGCCVHRRRRRVNVNIRSDKDSSVQTITESRAIKRF